MGSRLTRGPGRRAPRSARPPGLAVLAGLCAGLAVIACVTLLVALLTGTTAGAAVPSYPGPSATAADGSGPLQPAARRSERWQWPLSPPPTVARRFDPPSVRWAAGHRGIDLVGAEGMPVYAAGGGSISYAGRLAGRGVVTVTHGALRTTYEPVRVVVHVGDEVVAGEKIGALESFGSHCAPTSCLHWGLLRGERYLDPLAPLRRGPSRLLPVWGRPEPVFNDTVSGPAAPRDPGSRQPGSSPVDVAPSEGARDAPGRAAATTFAGAATAGAFLVYRGRRR